MILDFSITNFRSLKDTQTISFEATNDSHLEDYYVVKKDKYRVLKIASILGANASGKSNVLRAFQVLRKLIQSPCVKKTDLIAVDCFALDADCANKDTKFVLNFLCGEQKYHYEVSFNRVMVTGELLMKLPFGEKRPHTVFERATDVNTKVSKVVFGSKYKSAEATRTINDNLLHNRTVFGAYLHCNLDLPWMSEIMEWANDYLMLNIYPSNQNINKYVTRLIAAGEISGEAITELLHKADVGVNGVRLKEEEKIIPDDIINMIISDEDVPDEVKIKLKSNPKTREVKVSLVHQGAECDVPFDFAKESGGTQRYYELSGVLFQLITQSHFVAIDELEFRLHPDLYIHFITTYLNHAQESQLLFTTHMREFLNDRDLFRDDAVWFTEKSETGATELYSLADFGSDILRNSTNRYNAYLLGRLGAIPKLSSINIDKLKP